MTTSKKQQQIEKRLLYEVDTFLTSTTALQCMDSITFLLLSMDENGERLLAMDTDPLKPLMRMLSNMARVQLTEMQP